MRKTILALLLSVCHLTIATASNNLLPEWFGQEDAQTRIGMAPPTDNAEQARTIALLNATLSYLRTQQEGKLKAISKLDISNHQDNDEATSIVLIKNQTEVMYDHFICDLVDEFRNSRGEYFVCCRFGRDDRSENTVVINQKWTSQDFGQECIQFANIQLTMQLDGKTYRCLMSCENKANQSLDIQIVTPEGEVILPHGLTYSKWTGPTLSHSSTLPFTTTETGQSLGFIQLMTYNLLPFVPQRISGTQMIKDNVAYNTNEDGEMSLFRSNYQCKCDILLDSLCHPFNIQFGQLSKQGGQLQIGHVNFDDTEDNYDIPYAAHIGGFNFDDPRGGIQRLLRGLDIYYIGLWEVWNKKIQEEKAQKKAQKEATKELKPTQQSTEDGLMHAADDSFSSSTATDIGVRWGFSNIPDMTTVNAEYKKALKNGRTTPHYGFWLRLR